MNAPFVAPSRILHAPGVVVDRPPLLFDGIDAESFLRVDWINETLAGHKGSYWLAKGRRNVIWASDGTARIAAVDAWRIRRYLYRGIVRRQEALLRSYRGGDKVPLLSNVQVINFGANIGEVALAIARSGCQVTAIEPDPNVLVALLLNTKGFPIKVLPYAAWHTDGSLPLYIATEKADTSAVNHSEEKITAAGRTLDTITDELGLDRIHWIVGDAEGGEPEILRGGTETLKRTRYVSVRTALERRGRSSRDLCIPILKEAGFAIIYDENETLIGCNPNVC